MVFNIFFSFWSYIAHQVRPFRRTLNGNNSLRNSCRYMIKLSIVLVQIFVMIAAIHAKKLLCLGILYFKPVCHNISFAKNYSLSHFSAKRFCIMQWNRFTGWKNCRWVIVIRICLRRKCFFLLLVVRGANEHKSSWHVSVSLCKCELSSYKFPLKKSVEETGNALNRAACSLPSWNWISPIQRSKTNIEATSLR